jgi:uncharacterized integral membrane protein
MDRGHSRLIVILLAGILIVLLIGREAAIELLGGAFWVALILGLFALIVAAVFGVVRASVRETRAYRDEVARDRREGRPWLYTFIVWPGLIGNFVVMGLAAFHYFGGECHAFKGDCLESIPLWGVPISVFAFGWAVYFFEAVVLRLRRRFSA